MTDDTDETTQNVQYDLACVDCAYERSVEGTFLDALDVADDHQEDAGEPPGDHFVNIEHNGHR
jgi:hypothetical protein